MLYGGGLLNLVWYENGLPLAKHQLRCIYSFLTEGGFRTKYILHTMQLWISASEYVLVGTKSLWLQKGFGQMQIGNIPWDLWSPPPTPQIQKLTTESWKRSLPKFGQIWCICLVILSHRNKILGRGESWPYPVGLLLDSMFTPHCKFEIQRETYFYKTNYRTRSSVDMWTWLLVIKLICPKPIILPPMMVVIFRQYMCHQQFW